MQYKLEVCLFLFANVEHLKLRHRFQFIYQLIVITTRDRMCAYSHSNSKFNFDLIKYQNIKIRLHLNELNKKLYYLYVKENVNFFSNSKNGN